MIPNPLARGFSYGWQIGQALFDAGILTTFENDMARLHEWFFPTHIMPAFSLNGWTLVTQCRAGPANNWIVSSNQVCANFNQNVSAPGGNIPPANWPQNMGQAITPTTATNLVTRVCPAGNFNPTLQAYPAAAVAIYSRTITGPSTAPGVKPAPTPFVSPVELPMVFPIAAPIASPSVAPVVRPSPSEGSEPSNNPTPRPGRRPGDKYEYHIPPIADVPFIRVPPEIPPVIDILPPTTIITAPPASGGGAPRPPVIQRVPSTPRDAPPPRRVYQTKNNVRVIAGEVLWTGINTVTEAVDFLVVAFNQLPKGIRPAKLRSKGDKSMYMLSHFDAWKHLDAAEVLKEYLKSVVADYAVGKAARPFKKLYKQTGQITGAQRALSNNLHAVGDLAEDVIAAVENSMPVLDVDYATGRVFLRWN